MSNELTVKGMVISTGIVRGSAVERWVKANAMQRDDIFPAIGSTLPIAIATSDAGGVHACPIFP